jgi:hypothetical protein
MSFFYYTIGGCLQARAPDYIVRQAGFELYDALQARLFCYVSGPRQMGKSSLLVRSKTRLQQAGAQCAFLDMSRLGNQGLTQPQWYAGVMISLLRGFGLSKSIDFDQWWQAHRGLTPVQQLKQLVEDVLIPEAEGPPVYIFLDEIDALINLDFPTDNFFTWMRSCYNQRVDNPRYRRLNFALFGAAPTADFRLIQQYSPFRLGRVIALTDFTLAECASLQPGLAPWVVHSQRVLNSILHWTGGQPFLTQRLCDIAVQKAAQARVLTLSLLLRMVEVWVENLVRSHLINNWKTQDDPIHLPTIKNHLCWHQNRTERILDLCQQLLQGVPVDVDHSPEQTVLLSSGLVVGLGDQLCIKNEIYRQVFSSEWINLKQQHVFCSR